MWYRAVDYPVENLVNNAPLQCTQRRGKNSRDYLYIISCFDVETSKIHVTGELQAFVYVWQWAFGNDVVFGRDLSSFKVFCERIIYAMPNRVHLKVWVHNLSYEFAYLKGVIHFTPESVFCVSKRKILRADYGPIEFCCSYLHSGLSLKAWARDLKAPHQKCDGGKFDYSEVRYPWTPLTKRQLTYCANDVLAVVDCIRIEMQRDGDTLDTIPYTKTGYVRRVMKRAIKENVSYTLMRDIQPSYPLYKLLRSAFRGGDTHASRFYTGQIVRDVHHVDRSSSYPDELVNRPFPMSKFVQVSNPTLEDVGAAIRHQKAVIMRISIDNARLRRPWRTSVPYIAVDRCSPLLHPVTDNGRVLSADYLEIAVTDIDYKLILKQYDGDVNVLEMWSARYGMLPDAVRDVVRDLYRMKTELKGLPDQALIYALSKAMLNSCYGMCAQDPGKPLIEYIAEDLKQFVISTEKTQEKLVKDYAKKAFLPYQVGVWVTSWARSDLHEIVSTIDDLPADAEGRYPADFIYCDTDSAFYRGTVDWSAYQRERRERSAANGACAKDRKGKMHCMGELDSDPAEECQTFATMGAKKYAWTDYHGTLHITIAGVQKEKGAQELQRMGGLRKFVDTENPPLFVEAGGTMITYNDNIHIDLCINGHDLTITDNAVITDSTYQLSTEADYMRLLNMIENNIELIEFMGEW